MLDLTRVATTIDTGRAAKALAGPGMDTRTWVWPAVVTKVTFDPKNGYILDVLLLPDEQPETAVWAPVYSGPGYGFFTPVEVDDNVIVIAPHGDPDHGLIAIARPWSGGEPPPAEIADKPADLLLLAKTDATVRVAVQGQGNVVLDPRGTGKVLAGGDDASEPTLLGNTYRKGETSSNNAVANALALAAAALADAAIAFGTIAAQAAPPGAGLINAGIAADLGTAATAIGLAVTALTDAATAITDFEAEAPEFLTQKVNVK